MLNIRILIVLFIFAIAIAVIQNTETVQKIAILKPLSEFPDYIGEWRHVNSTELNQSVIDMLGVDDYLNANYLSPKGNIVNLYISYFEAIGVTGAYHSPLNCLPGGGIKILRDEKIKIGRDLKNIRKLTLEQNKQIIYSYYWYYNRGRVVYSEYAEKIFLVLDAVFKKRRDGAFIRIISYPNAKGNYNLDHVIDFISQVEEISSEYLPGKTL